MSRGPGAIERAIQALFTSRPDWVFLTDDLVEAAYPGLNRIEKKHRVAVLRAAGKVCRRCWWGSLRAGKTGGQIVYFNLCNVRSYALGRLRADFLYWQWHPTIDSLLPLLDDPARHNNLGKDIQPGGAWHTHVEINSLQRDGRVTEARQLRDAWNSQINKLLGTVSVGRP